MSVSSGLFLITPGITAACVAICASANCGKGTVASIAPGASRTPAPSVASDTGGFTPLSTIITLQLTSGELATTRAEPCATPVIGITTDSR